MLVVNWVVLKLKTMVDQIVLFCMKSLGDSLLKAFLVKIIFLD